METVSTKVDDQTRYQLEKLLKSGEFKSKSEIMRRALRDFISRKQLRWESRAEMRTFFKKRSLALSGEIIEKIREEEDL